MARVANACGKPPSSTRPSRVLQGRAGTHHRDDVVVVAVHLPRSPPRRSPTPSCSWVACNSCRAGVTPGPGLEIANAASGKRAAASTTTQPPWLWPKSPTRPPTWACSSSRQQMASAAGARRSPLPASDRSASHPALVEGRDGDSSCEQVISDGRKEDVVVAIRGARAGVHEHRVAAASPAGSHSVPASATSPLRAVSSYDIGRFSTNGSISSSDRSPAPTPTPLLR